MLLRQLLQRAESEKYYTITVTNIITITGYFGLQNFMKSGAYEPHFTGIQTDLEKSFLISQLQTRKQLSGLSTLHSGLLIIFE